MKINKRIFQLGGALLFAAGLLCPQAVLAQDDDPVDDPVDDGPNGYAKVWVSAIAAPVEADLGNSVRVNSTLWRASREVKNTVFAVSGGYAQVTIGAKEVAQKQAGYKFAYWYLDNGDGTFNINEDTQVVEGSIEGDVTVVKDENASGGGSLIYTLYIKVDEADVYATKDEAEAAPDVAAPTTLFAYFSDGDFVATSTGMPDYGTVSIDKVVNHPGDAITLSATPAEGYVFDYWKDAANGTTIVSRENPWSTTSQGSTTYYAVFSEQDALTIDFPEEGGFKVIVLGKDDTNWVADEAAGLTNYLFDANDLLTTGGRQVLNVDNKDAKRYILNKQASDYWSNSTPNFVYGKGRVKMSRRQSYGEGRENAKLLLYADKAQVFPVESSFAEDRVTDATVYVWNEALQAFLRFGDTHTGKVIVPAGTAYLLVRGTEPAEQLAVGTSADAYDAGVSYLQSGTETVSVGAEGVGTIVTTQATDFSTAATVAAYRATVAADGVTVTFSRVTRVPAGTALLVRSLGGGAAEEAVPVVAAAAAVANQLKPAGAEAEGQRYVLADGAHGIAFYPAAETLAIPEGKAFLDVPAGVTAPYLALPGAATTGVRTVEGTTAPVRPAGAYTLSGQRVSRLVRGVYIVDGRKVVVHTANQ